MIAHNLVIHLARKPSNTTVAQTVEAHGVGGLNIDAGRISGPKRLSGNKTNLGSLQSTAGWGIRHLADEDKENTNKGRWPANLILEHLTNCRVVGTTEDAKVVINRWDDGAKPFGGGAGHKYSSFEQPALALEVWECEPGCPIAELNRQGVVMGAHAAGSKRAPSGHLPDYEASNYQFGGDWWRFVDTGGVSRFFKQIQGDINE